jgi:hypothetical protein
MGQQFLERQSPPGRMAAALQFRHRRVRRRLVQQPHRFGDGRQLQLGQQQRWQPLRQQHRRIQLLQRLFGQAAQGELL